MRASIPALTLLLVGCQPAGSGQPREPMGGGTPAGTPGGPVTGLATGTGTGATTSVIDCDNLPGAPRPWTTIDLEMEEDFDFDFEGYALVQSGSTVLGRDRYGNTKIVSSTASVDPSGIQVLSTNEIVVGAQDEGSLKLVDPTTGGWVVILGGMIQPNGLEIGANDRIYVSEMTTDGRVRWFDHATGQQGVVLDHTWMPNGIVLSPDEQVLYVGGTTNGGLNGAILAADRIDANTWDSGNPRVIFEVPNRDFDGVETDICGNIYTVEYDTGRVIRLSPDGALTELANLDDGTGWGVEFNSIRWGNGVGGWDPTVLYVTNRNTLFPVEIGIPGKPSPSSTWVP